MSRSSTQSRGTRPRNACSKRPAATPSSTATEPSPKYLELGRGSSVCIVMTPQHALVGNLGAQGAGQNEQENEDANTPLVQLFLIVQGGIGVQQGRQRAG